MNAKLTQPRGARSAPFVVRELDGFDNVALLALARQCTTGTTRFRVDRAPDYFALLRYFGADNHRVWGVFGPDGHRLVGSMALSAQRRHIDGRPMTVDYLHDLRIHPEYRRTTACLQLLAAVGHGLEPGRPRIATVLGDNPKGSALVRHAARYFGAPRQVAKTWHRVATTASPVADLSVHRIHPAAWASGYRLWARNRDGAADAATAMRAAETAAFRAVRDGDGRVVAVFADIDQRRERTLRGPDERALDVHYVACFAGQPEHMEGALCAARADVLQRHPRSLVAWGAPCPDDAARRPGDALLSTTWAFGDAPLPELTAHELTLI